MLTSGESYEILKDALWLLSLGWPPKYSCAIAETALGFVLADVTLRVKRDTIARFVEPLPDLEGQALNDWCREAALGLTIDKWRLYKERMYSLFNEVNESKRV